MQLRLEGLDLLQQVVDQLARRAGGDAGDVVDGFVGVQLDELAAGDVQRVDDVRADLEQAQLEHLEEAGGAGADDEGVGFDHSLVIPANAGIHWGNGPRLSPG